MEDRFSIMIENEHTGTTLCGIFDGHGGEVLACGGGGGRGEGRGYGGICELAKGKVRLWSVCNARVENGHFRPCQLLH